MAQLRTSDDRKTHLLTRGNVDGIVSAAFFLAQDAATRVTFVPSGDMAVEPLRRDISSQMYLVDLGLTPRLMKAINDKGKTRQRVCYLDHHLQSAMEWHRLHGTDGEVRQGMSAASVAYEHLGLDGPHAKLAALADLVEYCPTSRLAQACAEFGRARMESEARMLDFSWRLRVDDDRFRLQAARRLSSGQWPSQVPEIRARYLQMVNENRWERALERVRERVEMRHNVALLRFGRRKPSLFGFGSRALAAVAREQGADVAVLLNMRSSLSSMSLRRTGPDAQALDLGGFVHDFTQHHGVVGGGHPHSAGARIHTRSVPDFLREVYCLA